MEKKPDLISERASTLFAQALCLFDDYRLVTRSQEKFITLNEDFAVELFTPYQIVFWSQNVIVLSIDGTSSNAKPQLDFDGTEDDLYIITAVLDSLLQKICSNYDRDSSAIQKKTFEVISALAQKYKDRD